MEEPVKSLINPFAPEGLRFCTLKMKMGKTNDFPALGSPSLSTQVPRGDWTASAASSIANLL